MPEQLSEKALCRRIHQQLRKQYGFSLRKTRGNKAKQELGIYFVLDEPTNKIIRWHIENLSAFYRDLMDFDGPHAPLPRAVALEGCRAASIHVTTSPKVDAHGALSIARLASVYAMRASASVARRRAHRGSA